jgi:hypothetical protein
MTENTGTAIVLEGKIFVSINHGLAETPLINDIKVTPTNNMGSATKFWISDITHRHLLVYCL